MCPTSDTVQAKGVDARSVLLPSTLSVALTERVDMAVLPTANGEVSASSTDLVISTTQSSGFEVLVNGIDGTTLANSYHADVISSITTASKFSSFINNTWGVYVGESDVDGNSVFQPITDAPTSVMEATGEDASGTYKLAFGMKTDTTLPAGVYRRKVLVSVVAKPLEIKTISDLTYMQEMTSEYCAYSTVHETKQLIDIRDSKAYWVAKLADGNCWMTQNLALDLSTNKVLTPNDTDVAINYRPTRNTETVVPEKYSAESAVKVARSWNLGNYVYMTPTNNASCGQAAGATDANNNVLSGGNFTNLSCGNRYKVYSEGDDAHYLVGNYYSYSAATAKTGDDLAGSADGSSVASGSICPKGWRLPVSGFDGLYPHSDGEFYRLLRSYGYPAGSGWTVPDSNGAQYTLLVQSGVTRLEVNPMYFTRGGYINMKISALRHVGVRGLYWSASAYDDLTSLNLDMNANNVGLRHDSRSFAFNVRCVAR